jgi:hypothetical protein
LCIHDDGPAYVGTDGTLEWWGYGKNIIEDVDEMTGFYA